MRRQSKTFWTAAAALWEEQFELTMKHDPDSVWEWGGFHTS
jgi:hypothetical protein